jgi:cellulose synthase/poly-beta-1,6-N-acetylglucosamine synthase-like glycosyltransferase
MLELVGTEVSTLRIAMMAVGLAFMILVARQVRHRTWPRAQVLLWGGMSTSLVVVAIFPALVSLLLSPFALDEGAGYPRIIGLLVASVLFLLFYQAHLSGSIELSKRQLTNLVRELALSRYARELGEASPPDVLIVIPAYNEEETLASVLESVPDTIGGLRAETVVIVDGAKDRTEEIARRYGVPVVLPVNRGQTAALVTGYEVAKFRRARIVATIDADGQMVPSELDRLVLPVANDEYDLVNGSRVLGDHEAESSIRKLGVTFFGLLASFLLRRRVTDTSVGMRAINVTALARMQLIEERFGAAELLVEASRQKLRMLEVPVTILARAGGETRKPAALRYGAKFASAMIRSWLR